MFLVFQILSSVLLSWTAEPGTREQLFCPFTQAFETSCEYEDYKQEETGVNFLDTFFPRTFEGVTPCQLWKWVKVAENTPYSPLREYLGHLKKMLSLKVDLNKIYEALGAPPEPPKLQTLMEHHWEQAVEPLSSTDRATILSKLKTINFRSMDPTLVDLLIKYGMMFEVDTLAWKRLVGSVVSAYVIPLGEYNLVLFGHTQHDFVPEGSFQEVYYTFVGGCSASLAPKFCSDQFIPKDPTNIEIGIRGAFQQSSPGLPFNDKLESFFSVDTRTPLYETKVHISANGELLAGYKNPTGEWENAELSVDESGHFVFLTPEKMCDPEKSASKTLVIRPISLATQAKFLFEKIETWKESEFAVPLFSGKQGVEKGCKSTLSYSEWAARVANQLKFWNADRPSAEDIYQALIYLRFQSRVKGGRLTRVKDKVVVGGLREVSEELTFPLYSEIETQAIRYIESNAEKASSKSTVIFVKKMDSQFLGELWFYRKPISVWFDERKNKKVRVIYHYPQDWKTPYQTLFMDEVNIALTSCEEIEKKKERLLRAFYVLFNISPLQQGDEIVAKVYFTALYERIFSKRLRKPNEFQNMNWDALTQSPEDFVAKYISKL